MSNYEYNDKDFKKPKVTDRLFNKNQMKNRTIDKISSRTEYYSCFSTLSKVNSYINKDNSKEIKSNLEIQE